MDQNVIDAAIMQMHELSMNTDKAKAAQYGAELIKINVDPFMNWLNDKIESDAAPPDVTMAVTSCFAWQLITVLHAAAKDHEHFKRAVNIMKEGIPAYLDAIVTKMEKDGVGTTTPES